MDLLLLEKTLLGLFLSVVLAIAISKLRGKRFKLPPGPLPVPIFGNWLQVGDDLNHRNLTDLAKKFGDIFLLRMGQRNLVVVSSPELAKEVLHTQGVEFGSRTRNVVFDIFTGKGQDMVFTVYGEHWRKMRRIMTVPFFTNKNLRLLESKLANTKSTTNEGLKCAIDHILDAQQKGEINEDNVLYIVENINVAAIETTLWSIEWGIAELVNHPEIQRKLRNELDTVLGPGVPITEPDTQKLPYLQAVVKETLRLRMTIPLLVPHMNLHDAKLAGYDIPAESKILVNAWWLANNPANWKNPEEFRPERFLEEESKVEANGNDFKYLPFGAGRRSCPGIILALPILGITIGRLVQNFELLPPPGQSKLDTSEKGGQFSLHILKHSTIVVKPRVF
uniref:Trans-cinnamate 4-monooxygenase n=1 Tax=Cucumis sativus TaxID=3659 RepID=A0A0A0KEB6_CUCSA